MTFPSKTETTATGRNCSQSLLFKRAHTGYVSQNSTNLFENSATEDPHGQNSHMGSLPAISARDQRPGSLSSDQGENRAPSTARNLKASICLPRQTEEQSFLNHDFQKRQNGRSLGKTGKATTLSDPRFLNLEGSLHKTDRYRDGFLLLSASGLSVLERYGVPLYDYSTLCQRLNAQKTGVFNNDKNDRTGAENSIDPSVEL